MKFYILVFILSFIFNSCQNEKNINLERSSKMIEEDLKQISNLRIYFGHQSVGKNIVDGINEVLSNFNSSRLNTIKLNDSLKLPESFFVDSYIGKNFNPQSKCDDFFKKIEYNFSGNLDIALMKFCFVDITDDTDINEVFNFYKNTFNELESKYPNIQFIHITVPLESRSSIKQKIKRLLNYNYFVDVQNIKRNQFNDLLRDTYKNEVIFDLAKVQSTYLDGSRESFEQDGKVYYSFIEDYTNDGGHLNELGRRIVAKELIHTLAEVSRRN